MSKPSKSVVRQENVIIEVKSKVSRLVYVHNQFVAFVWFTLPVTSVSGTFMGRCPMLCSVVVVCDNTAHIPKPVSSLI